MTCSIVLVIALVFAATAHGSSSPPIPNGLSSCDPINPDWCAFPFPNNFFALSNSSTVTGIRLNLTEEALPTDIFRDGINPTEWNQLDGFSVTPMITTYFADLSLDNVPHHKDIQLSLATQSPTILLDAETNERIPHWCELDESNPKDPKQAFMIWPAYRLVSARRYIVAMRNLATLSTGDPIAPSPAFQSLRDNTSSSDPDVNLRRDYFEDIFQHLADAGVDRGDLQVAWDFTTGSTQSLTGRMTYMRDDAISRIPSGGPKYYIKRQQENVTPYTRRYIKGDMEVPLYLTSSRPGSHLVLDAQGNPVFQGFTNVSFSVQIPMSVAENGTTGMMVQYGHGLFGDQSEIQDTYLQEMGDEFQWTLFATNWWGLDNRDVPSLVKMIIFNNTDFSIVPDRCQQGVLNFIMLTKMMMGDFAKDPAVTFDGHAAYDPSRRGYDGNSCGGIMGSTFMAVTQDITRGAVGVPGAPFSLLLPRSQDFALLYDIVKLKYAHALDRIMLLNTFQLLWDRSDPSGYMSYITSDPLEDTPVHQMVLQYNLGDAQVTWLGALTLARSMGAVMFPNNPREDNEVLFGFEVVNGPVSSGAVAQGWDFGVPPVPQTDLPPSSTYDTHQCVRRDPRAQAQINEFFTNGTISNHCDPNTGCIPIQPPISLQGCPAPDVIDEKQALVQQSVDKYLGLWMLH